MFNRFALGDTLTLVSIGSSAKKMATAEDLTALHADSRFHEIVAGEIVQKALPSAKHGGAQSVIGQIVAPYRRSTRGPGGPGGWWFASEVEVQFEVHELFRPDVAGWRREKLAKLPDQVPVTVLPDWVCEVLSPSNASIDTVRKMRVYHRVGIPHYWIVDPMADTLSVLRWTDSGYLTVQNADRTERVRAEPFTEVEFSVGVLFGDDD